MAFVAEELRQVGHAVGVVTGLGARHLFRGALVLPSGPKKDVSTFQIQEWGHPYSAALQFKHVEHASNEFAPELVISSELTFGVRLATYHQGLPHVTVGSLSWHYPYSRSLRSQDPIDLPRVSRTVWFWDYAALAVS